MTEADLQPRLYRRMLLIRRFEERVYRLFLDGEIPGTLHQYQGQEAVAVGVCDVLRLDDWITSTHRPHGHALAKGVSARGAMAELYGKATGCCGGKGGSMHLGDPEVGMVPAIAIVGGGNTVVTGLGLAFKLMRTDQVAVCFFGDGATNEGAFHEGLNFAAVARLPIVLVCENNLYGASTPLRPRLAGSGCRRPRQGVRRTGSDCRRDGRAGSARGQPPRPWSAARPGAGPASSSSARPTALRVTAAARRARLPENARRRPCGWRAIWLLQSRRAIRLDVRR